MPRYRRVVVKLSGEALAGDAGTGADPASLARVADEVLAESAIEFEHNVDESEDVVEKFKEFLDHVSPEDFAAGDS